MDPDIFISDFERTEFSDSIHGILGRSLIIATRFDSMCVSLSKYLEIKCFSSEKYMADDKEFDAFINKLSKKYISLGSAIKSFELPKDQHKILNRARIARNKIAHSVAKGLEGCIDTKFNERDVEYFIKDLQKLLSDIIDADILLSMLTTIINKDPMPNDIYIRSYKDNVLKWAVEL